MRTSLPSGTFILKNEALSILSDKASLLWFYFEKEKPCCKLPVKIQLPSRGFILKKTP